MEYICTATTYPTKERTAITTMTNNGTNNQGVSFSSHHLGLDGGSLATIFKDELNDTNFFVIDYIHTFAPIYIPTLFMYSNPHIWQWRKNSKQWTTIKLWTTILCIPCETASWKECDEKEKRTIYHKKCTIREKSKRHNTKEGVVWLQYKT